MTRPKRRTYTEETQDLALELTAIIGTMGAAQLLDVPEPNIRKWRKVREGYIPTRATQRYEDSYITLVLELAKETGLPAACALYDVPLGTGKRWRRLKIYGVGHGRTGPYDEDIKLKVAETARTTSDVDAGKEFGVLPEVLRRWRAAEGESLVPKRKVHSPEKKAAALQLAMVSGLVAASEAFNIPEGTIRWWIQKSLKRVRKPQVHLSEKERIAAVALAVSVGLQEAAKITGVRYGTLSKWKSKAGKTRKRGASKLHDTDLRWLASEQPHMEEWRLPASEWLKQEPQGLSQRLASMVKFFSAYIVPFGISKPATFLDRREVFPDFYKTACPDSMYGVMCAKNVHDFIAWILIERFSAPDDYGRPVISPAFHNPVPRPRATGFTYRDQTVYSPLPMGYIDEVQQLLAQGPNFQDWRWAQKAMHSAHKNYGRDWFTATESQIDRNDPDCVWRIRKRQQWSGGPILEMWSPVRWVALLIKNMLPLRTLQVRVLDSGEADTWRVERTSQGDWEWHPNKSHLSIGKISAPHAMGVLKRVVGPSGQPPDLCLYINTNKTADSLRSGHQKGYVVAWPLGTPLQSDPFYWLHKLRNWQEKYNPIAARSSWTVLDSRHIHKKSPEQLASFEDSCFLFRMPENSPTERHLPLTESTLDTPWYYLLRELERRLSSRGEVHSDGSKIRLVTDPLLASAGTLFPLHGLRVSLLSALALDGKVPFSILQKIAGHSRFLMTLYYVKPGEEHIRQEIRLGLERLSAAKTSTIVSFLKTTEFDRIVEQTVCNSPSALGMVIPTHLESRNPAGWLPMHLGLCLVGGNTSPHEGNTDIGGCYNGGPDQGSIGAPKYMPVLGGARNCVSCRWFVTEPFYLPALVSEFNNTAYHQNEIALECLRTESRLHGLKARRLDAEQSDSLFLEVDELRAVERLLEQQVNRLSILSHKLADCLRLIERCIAVLRDGSDLDQPPPRSLIAVGGELELKVAIEDIDSELLQLSYVNESVEAYPELEAGKAVVRMGQILDAALLRDGLPPVFLALTEEQQLQAGNAFIRALSRARNPTDTSAGRREVVSILDARKSLREQGIDMSGLMNDLRKEVAVLIG